MRALGPPGISRRALIVCQFFLFFAACCTRIYRTNYKSALSVRLQSHSVHIMSALGPPVISWRALNARAFPCFLLHVVRAISDKLHERALGVPAIS